MPNPGDDLIARVVGAPDHTWFYWTGRESVGELERTLAVAGRSLDSFETILDFGCGCGRMLLWLEEIGASAALHGTDIDVEAIEWARKNIPYAKLSVNEGDPPLPFDDATFDLVFNHSVFTHIDERRQDAWLTELQRVVRPGGLLVLSTHGEVALGEDAFRIRERLEDEGIVFIDRLFAPDFALPDWYQNTYHAPWYVFEHWGRWFEILAYVPGAALGVQDHILLKRVADTPGPRTPLASRPVRVPAEPVGTALRNACSATDFAATQAARIAAAAAPSRFGAPGKLARRFALRLMRPYSAHQDEFNRATERSVSELGRATDDHAARIDALERRLRQR